MMTETHINGGHAADMTNLLQTLVARGAISQEGQGRWTRYRLPALSDSLPSKTDSLHKSVHSLRKADHSLHKVDHSLHNDDRLKKSGWALVADHIEDVLTMVEVGSHNIGAGNKV